MPEVRHRKVKLGDAYIQVVELDTRRKRSTFLKAGRLLSGSMRKWSIRIRIRMNLTSSL